MGKIDPARSRMPSNLLSQRFVLDSVPTKKTTFSIYSGVPRNGKSAAWEQGANTKKKSRQTLEKLFHITRIELLDTLEN